MKDNIYSAYWIIFEMTILIIMWICFSTFAYGETVSINSDKTYEQCEREAFQKIYNSINKSFSNIK